MKVTEFNRTDPTGVHKYRKEGHLHTQYSLVDLNTGLTLLTVRTYWPGSVCYACAWTHATLGYGGGAGKAGGGGYHKESAAIEAALHSAGFRFDESFGGRGDRAIEEAIGAVARFAGLRSRFVIVKAHG